MIKPTFTLVAALLIAGAGCADTARPSICDVAPDELVIFPSDQVSVPPNVVIRVLAGRAADDLGVVLARADGGPQEPGTATLFVTSFGDVLEFTPTFALDSDTRYRVDVVEPLGDVVATTFFTTGTFGEPHISAGASGEVFIEGIAGEDRGCCTGGGCADGTVVQLPPLDGDNYAPQLLLLTVDERYNDACGAQRAQVGVIPVVWEGPSTQGVIAESDLILEGCFEVGIVTQTLREVHPGGVVCTPGHSFTPLPPTAACHTSAGGGCHAASGGARPVSAALLALLLLGWLLRRRRAAP